MTTPSQTRVVVVTGAARGIGAATARAFAARGDSVVIGDLDLATATRVADEIGGRALPLDVSDPDSFRTFLDAVVREHGRLDVLVNNAGFMVLGRHTDVPLGRQLAQVDVNLLGVVHGCHLAAERMEPGGVIVNLASLAGRIAMPGSAVYSATKAAVLAYSEALDAELAADGIRVSCVLPSFTATELIEGTRGTNKLMKPNTPESVAAAVVRASGKHRPVRTVPRMLALSGASWNLVHARAKPWLRARFGLDHVFLDVDAEARAAYVKRNERVPRADAAEATY